MTRTLRFLTGVCVLAGVALAQPRPNFSGTWESDPGNSDLLPNSTFRKKITWIFRLDGSKLEIKDETAPAGSPPWTFILDGKPTAVVFGVPQVAAAKWDGNRILIQWNQATVESRAPGKPGPVRKRSLTPFNWTFSVSPGSKVLTLEFQILAPNVEAGEKVVFVRRK